MWIVCVCVVCVRGGVRPLGPDPERERGAQKDTHGREAGQRPSPVRERHTELARGPARLDPPVVADSEDDDVSELERQPGLCVCVCVR